jgi:hypothetical protein
MEGKSDSSATKGIIPNAFQHIFDAVNTASRDLQYLVRASYVQIYNEEVHDLLSKYPKLPRELKGDDTTGVFVKDLTSVVVKNVAGNWFFFCLFDLVSIIFPFLSLCYS